MAAWIITKQGVPTNELSRIFDRFYQVNNKHRQGGHAGLGLAIVKRIMELHHGNIVVQSEIDKGTAFTFMLPVWQPDYVKNGNAYLQ